MDAGPGGVVAAVDLGASSGRVMTARVHEGGVELTEVHRFANRPVPAAGTLHWGILSLCQGVLDGLRAAGPVDSIGIDSWAVDYGLLDASGRLIGNPVHYRDERTTRVMERVVAEVGAASLHDVSDLQFLRFNTIYQLVAERDALAGAATLLMIPDLLTYWLTGLIGAETTNAPTTGLYDVRTGDWARPLMGRLGIPEGIFPPCGPRAPRPTSCVPTSPQRRASQPRTVLLGPAGCR